MNDKNLIKALKGLKQIKPSQNWVVSLKKEIIGEEKKISVFEVLPRMIFQHKLAYATVTVFMVLIGMLGLFLIPTSNNNKFETDLLASAVQSRYSLEATNQKLEYLTETAKSEKVDEITIQNINQSIAEASRTITKEIVENPKALKEIAGEVKKLDQNRRNLQVLGVVVDSDYQLNNVLQPLVQREIESLEKSTLNDAQRMTLEEIKRLYDEGQYADTLEKILLITNLK